MTPLLTDVKEAIKGTVFETRDIPRRILLGLGGTPYTAVAVNQAVSLAKRFEGEVTGVVAVDAKRLESVGPVPLGGSHAAEQMRNDRRRVTEEGIRHAVEDFEAACVAEGIAHTLVEKREGDPLETMISLARYHDIMLFGLRSIFEYSIWCENPRDALSRLLSAGVRPIIATPENPRKINKVLVAYSGSMESANTIKRYVQLRLWPAAEAKIVTFGQDELKAQELLADAAAYCRAHDLEVETEHCPGSFKQSLQPLVDAWGADLIAMGNSSRSLLVNRILPGNTIHTIQNSDRTLFLSQ